MADQVPPKKAPAAPRPRVPRKAPPRLGAAARKAPPLAAKRPAAPIPAAPGATPVASPSTESALPAADPTTGSPANLPPTTPPGLAAVFAPEAFEQASAPTAEGSGPFHQQPAAPVETAQDVFDAFPSRPETGGDSRGHHHSGAVIEQLIAQEQYQYGIAPSGPAVDPSEVETAAPALEVMVLWGHSILHVAHLSPPRDFVVGEPPEGKAGKSDAASVDFLMGADSLGTPAFTVVSLEDGRPIVHVPETATGYAMGEDGVPVDFLGLKQTGGLQERGSAWAYAMKSGDTVRVEYRGFAFMVKTVAAGKPIGAGGNRDKRPLAYVAGSALLHIFFLLMFYFLPPTSSSLAFDILDTDSELIQYAMKSEEEKQQLLPSQSAEEGGEPGEAAAEESGEMGKQDAPKTKNRFGIKGDSEKTELSRDEQVQQAQNAGILGVLAGAGGWDSPTSPFGKATALGGDPMNAMGGLMGAQVGQNFGFGGLGMSGAGRGGGGDGQGTIGVGGLGTVGGGGKGGKGYGSGKGKLGGRQGGVPTIRAGAVAVKGSLSKEAIRRVVQRHKREVSFCYEQALQQRPDLQGRVVISFIISPTGAVQSSAVGESSLGNRAVETCIASAVRRWGFPSPDGGGIVVVNYPFKLSAAN